MTNTKIPAAIKSDATLPANKVEIAEKARAYAEASSSANTRRAYDSDFDTFQAWCNVQGEQALPASVATVAAFTIDTAGKVAVSTQRRRLAAIQHVHREAGHHLDLTTPTFQTIWSGVRRTHGRPAKKKQAMITAMLRRALETLPNTLTGIRDRALLLAGFAGALRRTELAAAEIDAGQDAAVRFEETAEGITVHIAHSKGDQTGEGQSVAIPFGSHVETCPVRSMRAWLLASSITTGRIFRNINRHGQIGDSLSDRAVALIVKSAIMAGEIANGSTPEAAEAVATRFAGHSLRSGLATSAAMNDVNGALIQRQLRHKRFDTTAGYIQAADIYRKNAAAGVGL